MKDSDLAAYLLMAALRYMVTFLHHADALIDVGATGLCECRYMVYPTSDWPHGITSSAMMLLIKVFKRAMKLHT